MSELETRVALLEDRQDRIKDDIKEIKDLLATHTQAEMERYDEIHTAVSNAKFGWKVLGTIGGITAGVIAGAGTLWKVLNG